MPFLPTAGRHLCQWLGLQAYGVMDPGATLQLVRRLHMEARWCVRPHPSALVLLRLGPPLTHTPRACRSLDEVVPLVATNPATVLGLAHKGRVAVGADADLLLLAATDLGLHTVLARGAVVRTPQWTKGDMFDPLVFVGLDSHGVH